MTQSRGGNQQAMQDQQVMQQSQQTMQDHQFMQQQAMQQQAMQQQAMQQQAMQNQQTQHWPSEGSNNMIGNPILQQFNALGQQNISHPHQNHSHLNPIHHQNHAYPHNQNMGQPRHNQQQHVSHPAVNQQMVQQQTNMQNNLAQQQHAARQASHALHNSSSGGNVSTMNSSISNVNTSSGNIINSLNMCRGMNISPQMMMRMGNHNIGKNVNNSMVNHNMNTSMPSNAPHNNSIPNNNNGTGALHQNNMAVQNQHQSNGICNQMGKNVPHKNVQNNMSNHMNTASVGNNMNNMGHNISMSNASINNAISNSADAVSSSAMGNNVMTAMTNGASGGGEQKGNGTRNRSMMNQDNCKNIATIGEQMQKQKCDQQQQVQAQIVQQLVNSQQQVVNSQQPLVNQQHVVNQQQVAQAENQQVENGYQIQQNMTAMQNQIQQPVYQDNFQNKNVQNMIANQIAHQDQQLVQQDVAVNGIQNGFAGPCQRYEDAPTFEQISIKETSFKEMLAFLCQNCASLKNDKEFAVHVRSYFKKHPSYLGNTNHLSLRKYKPGTCVFEQGDLGNEFYIIKGGSAEVVLREEKQLQKSDRIRVVSRDLSFTTDTRVERGATGIIATFDATREFPYTVVLDGSGARGRVKLEEIEPIEVAKRHIVARLKKGDYFGEQGLLHSMPRQATVRAAGKKDTKRAVHGQNADNDDNDNDGNSAEDEDADNEDRDEIANALEEESGNRLTASSEDGNQANRITDQRVSSRTTPSQLEDGLQVYAFSPKLFQALGLAERFQFVRRQAVYKVRRNHNIKDTQKSIDFNTSYTTGGMSTSMQRSLEQGLNAAFGNSMSRLGRDISMNMPHGHSTQHGGCSIPNASGNRVNTTQNNFGSNSNNLATVFGITQYGNMVGSNVGMNNSVDNNGGMNHSEGPVDTNLNISELGSEATYDQRNVERMTLVDADGKVCVSSVRHLNIPAHDEQMTLKFLCPHKCVSEIEWCPTKGISPYMYFNGQKCQISKNWTGERQYSFTSNIYATMAAGNVPHDSSMPHNSGMPHNNSVPHSEPPRSSFSLSKARPSCGSTAFGSENELSAFPPIGLSTQQQLASRQFAQQLNRKEAAEKTVEDITFIKAAIGKLNLSNNKQIATGRQQIYPGQQFEQKFIPRMEGLMRNIKKRYVSAGDVIVNKGDVDCQECFIVAEGEFAFYDENRVQVGTVSAGGTFGELALVSHKPAQATVRCIGGATMISRRDNGQSRKDDANDGLAVGNSIASLWVIDRKTFRRTMKNPDKDAIIRYLRILDSIELFNCLLSEERQQLAESLIEINYKKGDTIIQRGDPGTIYFMLIDGKIEFTDGNSGEVTNTKMQGDENSDRMGGAGGNLRLGEALQDSAHSDGQIDNTFKTVEVKLNSTPPHCFGERALLRNEPRASTIRVTSERGATVLALMKDQFTEILHPLKDILMDIAFGDYRELEEVMRTGANYWSGKNGDGPLESTKSNADDSSISKLDNNDSTHNKDSPLNSCSSSSSITNLDPNARLLSAAFSSNSQKDRKSSSDSKAEVNFTPVVSRSENRSPATQQKRRYATQDSLMDRIPSTQVPPVVRIPTLDDFSKVTVLGAGCFGEVSLFQYKGGNHSSSKTITSTGSCVSNNVNNSTSSDQNCSVNAGNAGNVNSSVKPCLNHTERNNSNRPHTSCHISQQHMNNSENPSTNFPGSGNHDGLMGLYAIKSLSKCHALQKNLIANVKREKRTLQLCDSRFIVGLAASFSKSAFWYLALEFASGGDLFQAYRSRNLWGNLEKAKFYSAGVILAIEHLHERCIVYRDLKPENIVINAHGYPKLSDMGFAKELKNPHGRTFTFCGTVHYLAPEMLLSEYDVGGVGLAVDWWGVGILIHELLTGSAPFTGKTQMEQYGNIVHGNIPKHLANSQASLRDPDAADIVKNLLRKTPDQRLPYRNQSGRSRGRRSTSGNNKSGNIKGFLGLENPNAMCLDYLCDVKCTNCRIPLDRNRDFMRKQTAMQREMEELRRQNAELKKQLAKQQVTISTLRVETPESKGSSSTPKGNADKSTPDRPDNTTDSTTDTGRDSDKLGHSFDDQGRIVTSIEGIQRMDECLEQGNNVEQNTSSTSSSSDGDALLRSGVGSPILDTDLRTTLKAIRLHKFFSGFDWERMYRHRMEPPFIPCFNLNHNFKIGSQDKKKQLNHDVAPVEKEPIKNWDWARPGSF